MDLRVGGRQLAAAAADLALRRRLRWVRRFARLALLGLSRTARAAGQSADATARRRSGRCDVSCTADRCVNAVLAHKERGRLALARPLGDALSAAVSVWLDPPARGGAATNLQAALVPAPSSPGAVRRRGQDPLLRIARRACVTLRRAGFDCTLVPALRHRRRVSDQAGLGLVARQANLRGSMTIRDGCGDLACGPTGDHCGRCRDDRCDDRRACPGPAGGRAGANWRRCHRCGAMRVSPEQLRVSPPPASG